MKTIKCPKCGEVIKLNSTLDENELVELTEKIRKEQEQVFNAKVTALKAELGAKITQAEVTSKEASKQEIANLKEQLIKAQSDVKNADASLKLAVKEAEAKSVDTLNDLNNQIALLKAELTHLEESKVHAIKEAVNEKEVELTKTKAEVERVKTEASLKETKLKEDYNLQLHLKDEEIERYKDFRAKQSTKMVGESLEQYCMNEFNKLRAIAYPKAYFEKDNKLSDETNSKADFIFKDFMSNGDPFVSIIFDMKNEKDTTATKQKNEDFLKELDKDRKEKGCEYAVLVSTLEADNDFYNTGIVEVCKYEKMYVVRPQFFMTIISLLKNAAMNTIDAKLELAQCKQLNIDVQGFEDRLKTFQTGFSKNCIDAKNNFAKAIKEIDVSIKHMQDIKEKLELCGKHLGYADDKLSGLTIAKLTYNNPTMKELFQAIDNEPDTK